MKTLWTAAAIAHAAFTLAALTMAVSFARRVALRGRALLVLATLVALTAFFFAAAADALAHANGSPQFTSWTLGAFLLQNFVVLLTVHFYSLSVARLLQAAGESKKLALLPVAFSYALLLIAASRCFSAHSISDWLNGVSVAFSPSIIALYVGSIAPLFRRLANSPEGLTFWDRVFLGGQVLPDFVSLQISPAGAAQASLPLPPSGVEIRSLASTVIPLLIVNATSIFWDLQWSPLNVSLHTLLQLAMLPSIAGLIYFQTRAAFFDLLLKRGAVLAALLLFTLALTLAASLGAALAISGLTVFYAWTLLSSSLDTALDRIVFHRPDYRQTLTAITAALAKAATPSLAISSVTAALSSSLRAEWVTFNDAHDPTSTAFATVASPAKTWGVLSFGPRRRGQPYQSQDATFIDGVASQLAAALEGFDARAERQLAAEAELRALRAQINPHFLFNSLNSLADMVKESPDTEETVLNLARVFRYALDSTRQEEVTIEEEIRFLTAFLDIERVRFEDRLNVRIACPDSLRARKVPPMLLQPLVENAIKHGISPQLEGGSIAIEIEPTANGIRASVSDTGAGFQPAAPTTGVGLENVRRRVQSLAGGSFQIESAPGKGTRIALEWAGS